MKQKSSLIANLRVFTDEEEGEGEGLEDVDARVNAEAHDERAVESERDEGGETETERGANICSCPSPNTM